VLVVLLHTRTHKNDTIEAGLVCIWRVFRTVDMIWFQVYQCRCSECRSWAVVLNPRMEAERKKTHWYKG
jgi:hypothetical protein